MISGSLYNDVDLQKDSDLQPCTKFEHIDCKLYSYIDLVLYLQLCKLQSRLTSALGSYSFPLGIKRDAPIQRITQ